VLFNLSRDEVVRRRPRSAENFEAEAKQLRQHALTLRDVLVASFRDTRSPLAGIGRGEEDEAAASGKG
jgi:hypothetical protein